MREGGSAGVSANENSCSCTQEPNKLWRSNSIFNNLRYRSLGVVLLILYLATQRLAFVKCYAKSAENILGRNFFINAISTKMLARKLFVKKSFRDLNVKKKRKIK
jgi:hypothetical protein